MTDTTVDEALEILRGKVAFCDRSGASDVMVPVAELSRVVTALDLAVGVVEGRGYRRAIKALRVEADRQSAEGSTTLWSVYATAADFLATPKGPTP
jgi:hypothetical protein